MIARLHGDQLERYRPKLRAVEVPPPNQVKTPPYPRTKTETFAAFAQPRPSRSNLGLPAWRLLVSAVWAGVFAATVYLANPVMPQYWWQSFTAGEGITAPNS